MDNILQNLGLVICIGAIILIALVALAARALFRPRNNQQVTDRDPMFQQRGSEQPRFDDRDVESRGGFGGVATTGGPSRARNRGAVAYDSDRDVDVNRTRNRGSDLADFDDTPRERRRTDNDDDDVRSSSGFGR